MSYMMPTYLAIAAISSLITAQPLEGTVSRLEERTGSSQEVTVTVSRPSLHQPVKLTDHANSMI